MSNSINPASHHAAPRMASSTFSFPVSIELYRHSMPSFLWNYQKLDQRQRTIANGVRKGEPGVLLVSELASIITRGKRTPSEDILLEANELKEQGIELYPVGRGGLATYHGPGQWTLFPVDRLEILIGDPRGVKHLVEVLLEVALKVTHFYHPEAEIRTGRHLGVWTSRGKVASVGIQVEDGILLHGFAVNGFQTEQSFVGLRPCGSDEPVDYLLSSASEAEFLRLRDRLIAETLKHLWRRPKSLGQIVQSGQQGLTCNAEQIINGSEPSLLIGS